MPTFALASCSGARGRKCQAAYGFQRFKIIGTKALRKISALLSGVADRRLTEQ